MVVTGLKLPDAGRSHTWIYRVLVTLSSLVFVDTSWNVIQHMIANFKRHYKLISPLYYLISGYEIQYTDTIKILLLLNGLEIQKNVNPMDISTAKISASMQFGKMPFSLQEKACQQLGLRMFTLTA